MSQNFNIDKTENLRKPMSSRIVTDKKIECCECRWLGTENQQKQIKNDTDHDNVCPNCDSKDFYLLSV